MSPDFLRERDELRPETKFMDAFLAGEFGPRAAEERWYDAVDAWHGRGPSAGPLHEFLGMTVAEHEALVEERLTLKQIAEARRR